ncbi:MAG: hypothetical protein JSU61_04520 [Fidelibacterota bacterium]|nr:MAG: hypothetical protein JSU61_04520 [Candidatus Neomarinimicrobiota bacterium]
MKRVAHYTALLLVLATAAVPLFAQVELHGHVYPLARISFEQKYLSLPHRVVSIEGHRSGKNVRLFFNTTLEYRLMENSAAVELQEAYAEWSTRLGDYRLGQHVLSWGAADGNNPTDNVNAYDFYYLFMGGGDRKQSNLMASANLYFGNLNLEAAVTPVFQPNRLPLDEPDFPIFEAGDLPFDPNTVPEVRPARKLENTEYGARLRLPLSIMDLSVSYFRGFDRMYTPAISVQLGLPPTISVDSLVYYPTQVLGGDLVTFLGDWAIRAEGAYFLTEDDDGDDPLIRNPYIQYVLQLDRADDNSNVVVQYLGTYITQLDGDDALDPATGELIAEDENEWDRIPPKMGMPFAAIAQNALMATASYDFADGRYSLQGQSLYEFDHNGYMLGGKLTIALEDAFDLELGVVHMDGDKDSRLSTIGDVFSHFYLAMKYSF